MFQNLGSIIKKKEKNFIKEIEGSSKINQAFSRFLSKYFPEGEGFKYRLSYNKANNKIIIETPNKTLASELIIRVDNLSKLLKEEGIITQHIIIY